MSKKILAIALFAVMVLSLVPFANAAAPVDYEFIGGEAANVTTGATAADSGDVWSKNSGDVVNLTIEKAWGDLDKESTGWYTADVAKFDVYAYLALETIANANGITTLNVNGSNRNINDNVALVTADTNFEGVGSAVDVDDSLTDDSAANSFATIQLKIASFEAKRGGNSEKYTIRLYYNSGWHEHIVNVTYKDTSGAPKGEQPMWLKFEHAGDEGLYNVYTVNGVIYIDYANDLDFSGAATADPILPLDIKFFADAAGTTKIPASGQRAEVDLSGTSDGTRGSSNFFVADDTNIAGSTATANTLPVSPTTTGVLGQRSFNTTDTSVDYDLTARFTDKLSAYVNIPSGANGTTNQTVSIKLQTADYYYAAEVKVVWRPVPRNQISNVVISQRNITLKVGESITLDVLPTMQTTYSTLKLMDSAARPIVNIDGMKLTGATVGTTAVNVYFGNQAIDAITVTVVAADSTTTPAAGNQWRVLARTLNVRTGPGTGYAKVGTLSMNSVVTGTDTGLGWIELSNGTYISKQYAVPVNAAAATGNYVTTASSLNVRSGPGSSYGKVGSLPKGSVVSVLAIQGSWAQTNAGWVSTLYLNAI